MLITLTRRAYLDTCTLGALEVDAEPLERVTLVTLERPWIRNPAGPGGMPEHSCVPDGLYELVPHDSPDHPATYLLENPQLGVYAAVLPQGLSYGRTECLIHIGNRVADVVGCIAVGLTLAVLAGEQQVESSSRAMALLRQALGRTEPHTLQIAPSTGTA